MKTKVKVIAVGLLLAAVGTGLSQPIIVTNQPQPMTNCAFTTAIFEVGATGTEPLAYQWQKSPDLFTFTDRLGDTNSTCVITNVQLADQAYYRVIITNIEGAVTSEVVRLTVLLPPSISSSSQPTNWLVVSIGASATNRVLASGTAPFSYQWRFNGTPLSGQTKASIVLTNLQVADAGSYDVVVANMCGSITSQVRVLVLDRTFTKITAAPWGNDLGNSSGAFGDYNNDGYMDMFISRYKVGRSALYHNNGDGSYRSVTNALFPMPVGDYWFAACCDLDNDGYVDIFAWCGASTPSRIYYNSAGSGLFTPLSLATVNPWAIAAVDFDRDGLLDLYLTSSAGGFANRPYRNLGGRNFQFVTEAGVGGIAGISTFGNAAFADYDDDGFVDVALASMSSSRCLLYRNDGTGRFVFQAANSISQALLRALVVNWGDYDNDGRLDLMIAVFGGESALYRNLGGGNFERASIGVTITGNCNGASWGDYDNDGFLDLFLTLYGNNNMLLRNNGDGTFTSIRTGSIVNDRVPGAGSYAGLWFDYDNDGFLDLFVPNGNDEATANVGNFFYRNNGNTNTWLKVKLLGMASNREGAGAKVWVQAAFAGATRWLRRDVTSGGDPYSGMGPIAHFGLGNATMVDQLRIEWPSGIVQTLTNVAAGQFFTVVESQGYIGAPPALGVPAVLSNSVLLSISEPAAPAVYALEASTNLLNWTKLLARTSTGGTFNYTNTFSASYSKRFYRVVAP
jgi:enediyne biosynthesis protein E4